MLIYIFLDYYTQRCNFKPQYSVFGLVRSSFKPCSSLGSGALEFVPHAVAPAELLTERHRHIHTLSRLPPTFEHTPG